MPTDYGYVLMDAYSEMQYLLPDAMFNLLYMYMSTPVIFEVADDLSKITYSYSFSFITEGTIDASNPKNNVPSTTILLLHDGSLLKSENPTLLS